MKISMSEETAGAEARPNSYKDRAAEIRSANGSSSELRTLTNPGTAGAVSATAAAVIRGASKTPKHNSPPTIE
jgi:hypothetical protein